MIVMAADVGFAAHYLEHGDAAGAGEPVAQRGGEDQEDDVQDGGVVPLDGGLEYLACLPAGMRPSPPKISSVRYPAAAMVA